MQPSGQENMTTENLTNVQVIVRAVKKKACDFEKAEKFFAMLKRMVGVENPLRRIFSAEDVSSAWTQITAHYEDAKKAPRTDNSQPNAQQPAAAAVQSVPATGRPTAPAPAPRAELVVARPPIDPGVTPDGLIEAQRHAKTNSEALSGVDVAFVSPLYRAALTACVMLPKSTKLIFTRDAAEFASDKFDRFGTPKDPKTNEPIFHREEELTGRTRRELEAPGVLGEKLKGREVEWDGIGLDDRWWDAPPETQSIAEERIQRICKRVSEQPGGVGVAIVCHSYWLKVAVPCLLRPKGTPSPLGTAAGYWPKNAVPYLGELTGSSQLGVLRKLTFQDLNNGILAVPGAEVAAELRQEVTAGMPRRLILIRHGESEAQALRKLERARSRSPRR